jgi:hypothetical protein
MPPRKRKGAAEQQAPTEQPDRDEVARRIQEKLRALDLAGATRAGGVRDGRLSRARLNRARPPCAVEERCAAVMEAATEIVDAFMQDFKIQLMTVVPKQVRRAAGARARAAARCSALPRPCARGLRRRP